MTKLALAVCVMLLCASCSQRFGVAVSGHSTGIRLRFAERGWLGFNTKTPCIRSVTVHEGEWPTGEIGREVWHIRAQGGCVELAAVDVGDTPRGFVTFDRLMLKPGRLYYAAVDGEWFSDKATQWWVCDGAPAAARWTGDRIDSFPPDCAPAVRREQQRNVRWMEMIERVVQMPPGARPLNEYSRFYSLGLGNKVLGTYVIARNPKAPAPPAICEWEKEDDVIEHVPCDFEGYRPKLVADQHAWIENWESVPFFFQNGGGCYIVSLVYDPKTRTVSGIGCHDPNPAFDPGGRKRARRWKPSWGW